MGRGLIREIKAGRRASEYITIKGCVDRPGEAHGAKEPSRRVNVPPGWGWVVERIGHGGLTPTAMMFRP